MIDALIWTHPELVRRYTLLVERCWAKGWDISITSSTRTEATQRLWYGLWQQGLWPNLVADPDRYYCQAPDELGGWTAKGSMHMIQQDGYSHALDLAWWGPSATQFRLEAFECGLRAVESTENWHYQFWDVSREVFPCPGDDDVTAEQLAAMFGPPDRVRVTAGVIEIHLFKEDGSDDGWWPVSDVWEFTHRHIKSIAEK